MYQVVGPRQEPSDLALRVRDYLRVFGDPLGHGAVHWGLARHSSLVGGRIYMCSRAAFQVGPRPVCILPSGLISIVTF